MSSARIKHSSLRTNHLTLAKELLIESRKLTVRIGIRATSRSGILANQHMESVGHLLATFAGIQGTEGTSGTESESAKSLELKEVAL